MADPDHSPRALRLDLLFYLVGLTFAAGSAIWSEFYGYRMWGNFATVGYLLALGLTIWRRPRWIPVGVVAVFAIVVPAAVLVFRRTSTFAWGPWPWSWPSQPEVWVVERSAHLLLDNGSPYSDLTILGRPPIPDDYTPYGPVMTIFGLPRAIFGDNPLTDARLWFLAVSVLAIVLTLRLLDWPGERRPKIWNRDGRAAMAIAGLVRRRSAGAIASRERGVLHSIPVSAAQLAVISPMTALTATVAGDDLPVIALIVLATALVYRSGPVPAGVACALVVNMKLTALPALVVLAVALLAFRGARALAVFLGAFVAATAAIVGPVLLAGPGAFVEHVIKFPAGLGQARSPAESPLPGHLLAEIGPVGHTVAIALLGIAACAITAWLVLRPPRTAADAIARIAAGLGAAIVLAPATRWGYLIYPLAMLGAMIVFSTTASRSDQPADTHAHGGTPVGPTASVVNPDTH